MSSHPFRRLDALDPALAAKLDSARRQGGRNLSATTIADIVDTVLLGFEREVHFGQSLVDGYCRLLGGGSAAALAFFSQEIKPAARRSTTLGLHLARILPTVLLTNDNRLPALFQETLTVLLAKGEYLVKAPLEGLLAIANSGDHAGRAYLELLQTVFDRSLSYNRCQYLGNLLPSAVKKMPAERRGSHIRQMTRLARVDLNLAEPFLAGLNQGLERLGTDALRRFVDQGLALARQDSQAARRFLAVVSGRGREACRVLQTAVLLADQQGRLNRYLKARTGHTGQVRAARAAHPSCRGRTESKIQAGTDGVHIYLPDSIDVFATRAENAHLLNVMVKFEAGLIEFGTFSFDLERARDLGCLGDMIRADSTAAKCAHSDFDAFSQSFDEPRLAMDLLTVFEHARVRLRLAQTYPGLVRDGLPLYQAAMRPGAFRGAPDHLLNGLYAVLSLDLPLPPVDGDRRELVDLVRDVADQFTAHNPSTMRVEHCAGLVAATYDQIQTALATTTTPQALSPPFRMPLQPELIAQAGYHDHQRADRLARRLRTWGLKAYRGDLCQLIQHTAGRPTPEDVERLCQPSAEKGNGDSDPLAKQWVHIPPDILNADAPADSITAPDDVDRISWQREWNDSIGDYLYDHVRVRDRRLAGADTAFFEAVLERRDGLVRRIRHAFELLRPEGLGILRQWVEGDDFDYRALLDVALDRRAGLLPSDRLYIKRVKQRRDVAVMLLVDLSRSTSNIVAGSHRSVLDVAKEAIVLFTQALEVVGDSYAVAGFSGTGRLGVDFFRIKDFDEPFGTGVKQTLSAMTPQRSTRMGAAVRRATRELMTRENRVRLLLLIGDGFPNDVEYKGDYAVQDTRQAIAEARSDGIVTQAITVNLPASPRLDDLFGPVRHAVISNVNELPDKLLRLYSALTRA